MKIPFRSEITIAGVAKRRRFLPRVVKNPAKKFRLFALRASASAALRGPFVACCCLTFTVAPAGLLAHGTFHERLNHLEGEIDVQPGDALLRCRLAELYCEHGNFPEALAAAEQAEKINPKFALLDLVRGDIFLQAGRLPEARAALDRYLKQTPANAHALLLRARTKAASGKPVESLADYRAALGAAVAPEPDLYQEVSDALAAQGLADEALVVLDKGLRALGPIPSLTLRAMELEVVTGRFDAALSRVDLLQKSSPRPEPWMAKRAQLLARAGRPAEARAVWEGLLAHLAALPNLERGSHAMSLLAEQARQALAALGPDKASAAGVGKSIEGASQSPDDILRRTILVRPGANHEEERHRANEQIVDSPADAAGWFHRSLLLVLDGEWDEALTDCLEVERLAPGKYATGMVRGQALAGQGKLMEGKAALDAFLATRPTHAHALGARAQIFLKLKQTEPALDDYRAALRATAGADLDLVKEAVTALLSAGRRDEALQVLNKGIAQLGPVTSLELQAFELETSSGRFDAALAHVDTLQKAAPQPEPWMARRAELLQRAGRPDEARAAWRALLRHIDALPSLQRGSPAMRQFSDQASTGLQTLLTVQTPALSALQP